MRDQLAPGVIFTLRQIKGRAQTREQNGLFPFYLLYVTQDGQVKLSFIHAKQILDYYKKLCNGQNQVLADLVQAFNEETHEGSRMTAYSKLLNIAVENLIGKEAGDRCSQPVQPGRNDLAKRILRWTGGL